MAPRGDVFVGRQGELAELSAVLERGGLALVAGEAGAGKTRLVTEALAASSRDAVWATCWEGDGAPVFWPWIQLIRGCLARPAGAAWLASGDAATDEVLALLPEEATTSVPADASRFRLFEGVSNLARAVAADAPLVLVLDDLQWADGPSVRLLVFVARSMRSAGVAILGTYRDTEVDPGHPLAQAVGDLAGLGRLLPLGGLDVDELDALVTASGRSGISPADLYRQTAGNPFFAREVISLAGAGGASVPGGVRAVIERRLARLSQPSHDTLLAAAVLGAQFSVDLVAAVASQRAADVLAHLDEAAAARIVRTDGDVMPGHAAFAHDLVRETLYDALGPAARAASHQRAAAAIEQLHGVDDESHLAELAHHLAQAVPLGDVARAVNAMTRAADRALALMADEDAAARYAQALSLLRLGPQDDDVATRLLLSLGEARLRTGDAAGARAAYEEAAGIARRRGRAQDLARAALGFGTGLSGFEVTTFDHAQIDLLEEALRALGPDDSPLRAWLLARLSVALSFIESQDRRLALSEDAVAMARRLGDRLVLGHALAAWCDAVAGPDHTEARLDASSEVVSIGVDLGDRPLELLGRRHRLVALLELGDLKAVDVEIDAFARIADALRQPMYRWYVPLWRAMRCMTRGDTDGAAAYNEQVSAIGELAHSANAEMLYLTQKWFRLRQLGDLSGAAAMSHGPVFEQMRELESGSSIFALVSLHEGLVDDARAGLEAAAATGLDIVRDAEWLPCMVQFVDLVLALDDREAAALLNDLIAPYDHRFAFEGIGAGVYGALGAYRARLLRMLGDDVEADRIAAEAERAETRAGLGARVPMTRDVVAQKPLPQPAAPTAPDERPRLIREGDVWSVTWDGSTARVKDTKGMRDLAVLLASPSRAVHAGELAGADGATRAVMSAGADPTLDREAIAAYRRRLAELEEELADAERDHDAGRADKARAERDFLVDELTGALGLGGRARRAGDPGERARKAVTARVRDAIDRIGQVDPALGRHLAHSVRTGTFCVYEPERPVVWHVG